MSDYSDAWVCTDCYFALHYGYDEISAGTADEASFVIGPDFDDVTDREPLAKLAGFEVADNTAGEVDDDFDEVDDGIKSFSWSRCDGCGSTLGGSRYRLAVSS